jgi:hypothetical protein
VGAQAAGYNSVSTGISNLGTFSSVEQTDVGIRAVAAVIAWKLALHGVPVEGTVTANGRTFERISGHRDANSTACPGDALYGQLDRIRELAAQGVGAPAPPRATLTLATTALKVRAGETVQLSGVLSNGDGSRPAGTVVALQRQGEGGYKTLRRTRTGGGGKWSLSFRRSSNTRIRMRARDAAGKVVRSRSVRIAVAPRVRASVARKRYARGERAVITGSVKPAKRSVSAVIERRVSGGDFRQVATVRGVARSGRFSLRVRLARPGLHRVTVRSAADIRNAAGRADPVQVRVGGRRQTGGSGSPA